jgi:hypothetical protein
MKNKDQNCTSLLESKGFFLFILFCAWYINHVSSFYKLDALISTLHTNASHTLFLTIQ